MITIKKRERRDETSAGGGEGKKKKSAKVTLKSFSLKKREKNNQGKFKREKYGYPGLGLQLPVK